MAPSLMIDRQDVKHQARSCGIGLGHCPSFYVSTQSNTVVPGLPISQFRWAEIYPGQAHHIRPEGAVHQCVDEGSSQQQYVGWPSYQHAALVQHHNVADPGHQWYLHVSCL